MPKVYCFTLEFTEYRSPGMPWTKRLKRINVNCNGWRNAKDPEYAHAQEYLLSNGFRIIRRHAGKGSVRTTREWWGHTSVFGKTGDWDVTDARAKVHALIGIGNIVSTEIDEAMV